MEFQLQIIPNRVFKRRNEPPGHYMVEFSSTDSFDSIKTKFESDAFYAGGYYWRLQVYPHGHKKIDDQNNCISMFLKLVSDIDVELHIITNFFIYQWHRQDYLSYEDGRIRPYTKLKKKWGIPKFVERQWFLENGFVCNKKCRFGVEVFVVPKNELLNRIALARPTPYYMTWQVSLDALDIALQSESFGRYNWYILLRRNGPTSPGMDYGISIFLYMDPDAFTSNQRVLVNFTLRVQDQIFGNHIDYTADKLFPAPRETMWGKENIMKVKHLTDPRKGFLVNGKFIIQAFVYDIGMSDFIGTNLLAR